MGKNSFVVRRLGLTDYETTWKAMQEFTLSRDEATPDELWLTEHFPVYTLGLNKKNVALPLRCDIPLVASDRGGKITYHGPGQLVLYLLLNLNRRNITIRQLVGRMESAVIDLLAEYGVDAQAKSNAPGVYVDGRKIASLGLRLKKGCCYHGLSLNLDMDLDPFTAIDPCGYQGLEVTQVRSFNIEQTPEILADQLIKLLIMHIEASV